MRVLVAGGTGALGRAVVPALVAAGHDVTSLSRRTAGPGGVAHVSADALDREAVMRAVAAAEPEVVVHALTAIPAGGPRRGKDLRATNALRTAGTDNLLAAASAAGVRRVVAESFMLVYGPGDHGAEPVPEAGPLHPPGRMGEVVGALRYLEDAVRGADLEGVVLRYGGFYGAGTGSTEAQAKLLRRRMLPLPGGAPAVLSWIHMDDAATATVRAVEDAAAGEAYNVADHEPVTLGDFLREMARATGAPEPRSVPIWLVRPLMPFAAAFAHDLRLPLANAKLKTLGWSPRHPTYREGLATLA